MKKRKDIKFEIKIPEGIEASMAGCMITMKKGENAIVRKIPERIKTEKAGDSIILSFKNAGRDEKKEAGTTRGHIKNMIEGLESGFEYELEICNVHFPMTVSFDKAKSEFMIKNILGEKSPRIAKVSPKAEVEIKAPKIKIKSYDIEAAGQAAASLEKAAVIRNRDRNKFQDGIFITKKPRRVYI